MNNKDDASTIYDIEMQTTTAENLPKRMRYYQAMIDLNTIERGSRYTELKKSYIIFICLENPYADTGLHKYSISSVCREDPSLNFKDEIYKVILSAQGDRQDVSPELQSFRLYLSDRKAESDFTKALDAKIRSARTHNEWRLEYMTLEERDELMREEGREEGRAEGRREHLIKTAKIIRKFMDIQKLSAKDAMDVLDIPADERDVYLAELS